MTQNNMSILFALKEVAKERNIPLEHIQKTLKDALMQAYKKQYGSDNVYIEFNDETGGIVLWIRKEVVEKVTDPQTQVTPEEALAMGATEEDISLGNVIDFEMASEVVEAFGRIAAQAAKQVITARLRDFERDTMREEFENKINTIMTVTVQRVERREIIVSVKRNDNDINRFEGVIPVSEQAHNEYLRKDDKIKVLVHSVRDSQRGPQIVFSRSSQLLLKGLFESVPEISKGIVSIKAVVREAGIRSKIAVKSEDPNIDPVGACVGPKGTRVQSIVDELRGEKIDIIPWSEDTAAFISSALQPAVVTSVTLSKDKDGKDTAIVVVADKYLPLAIGREGQNARLAAKLTDCHIDIRSESSVLAKANQKKATESTEKA